jgi:hypothetical protein
MRAVSSACLLSIVLMLPQGTRPVGQFGGSPLFGAFLNGALEKDVQGALTAGNSRGS